MQVGVNYPWFDYGWDFGLGPPAWRAGRSTPGWYAEIDDHLRLFQSLGISVVRWFILADGLTYGVEGAAPVPIRHAWRVAVRSPPSAASFSSIRRECSHDSKAHAQWPRPSSCDRFSSLFLFVNPGSDRSRS